MTIGQPTRRHFLHSSAAITGLSLLGEGRALRSQPAAAIKNIAAVVTEFRTNSHAEVIVGRWLEGFELDGSKERPRSKLVALYTDQVPKNDISRALAKKHDVPIYSTIRETLTRGGDKLAVDGVLLIGEHGDYPLNEKGQRLYPRRRFFEETVKVFRESNRVVPVFSDKHLSYNWENAKWMYDQAVALKMPLMAGSSLPLTWRKPAVEVEAGSSVEEILVVGYGGLESYGFHALETLQCLVERRKGGETGVAAVTCLEGPAVWKAGDDKQWSRGLLEAALSVGTAGTKKARAEEAAKKPAAFLIEYVDGARGTVLMLSGLTNEFLAAVRLTGKREPLATNFWLQPGRPFGHFTLLAQAIDQMFTTGKPTYPAERTLLTTGVLDAAINSHFEGHRRKSTPELAVRYRPGPAWRAPPEPRTGGKL
jgi:hypothetical protein